MSSPTLQSSGVSEGLRTYVWDSMLDGEMNDRYWRKRAGFYVFWEKWLKIFLAITSSGTVAAWAIPQIVHYVWRGLSGVSALLAMAMPFLDYTGQVERASDLRKGWWELTVEYKRLWACIDSSTDDSIDEQIKPLKAKEVEMSKIESKFFTRDENLIREYQKDVLRAGGYST
jgi:hypothetical protein